MASKEHHTGNVSPEYALLGFLIAGPSHGYDLHQRFRVELGQVWHLSQSQAYAILKRLEQHGDISAKLTGETSRTPDALPYPSRASSIL
jgi:DNA-binding PadR family transcriptional regulator